MVCNAAEDATLLGIQCCYVAQRMSMYYIQGVVFASNKQDILSCPTHESRLPIYLILIRLLLNISTNTLSFFQYRAFQFNRLTSLKCVLQVLKRNIETQIARFLFRLDWKVGVFNCLGIGFDLNNGLLNSCSNCLKFCVEQFLFGEIFLCFLRFK